MRAIVAGLSAASIVLSCVQPTLAFNSNHANASSFAGSQSSSRSLSSSTAYGGGGGQANSTAYGGTGIGGASRSGVSNQIISEPGNGVLSGGTAVGAFSYAGAANPCSVGGSLGVGVGLVGASASLSTESSDCTNRAWVILMSEQAAQFKNSAYEQWARGIECANPDRAQVAPPGMCPSSPTPVAPADYAALGYAAPVNDQTAQVCALWRDRRNWDISQGFQPIAMPYQCQ